jgi:hypothetical protein
MVRHLKHELELRAEAVRARLTEEEEQRDLMRLRGRSALEHASQLLHSVEQSLANDGSSSPSERGGLRRSPPLAPIHSDGTPSPDK